MRETEIVDHAIVDALQTLFEGTRAVHIVGALSDGARERLNLSLGGGLSTAEGPDGSRTRHETVVVLDPQRLGEAQAMVSPAGTLTVAAVNPGYGSFLAELLEGGRPPCWESADLDGVCDRLESDGWEVEEVTSLTVPLALIPFDPTRIPKTVLAFLYHRHPEIETYRFLVRARRPVGRPLRPRPAGRPPSADFPTMPWKTEAEWREEARRMVDALRADAAPHAAEIVRHSDAEEHFRAAAAKARAEATEARARVAVAESHSVRAEQHRAAAAEGQAAAEHQTAADGARAAAAEGRAAAEHQTAADGARAAAAEGRAAAEHQTAADGARAAAAESRAAEAERARATAEQRCADALAEAQRAHSEFWRVWGERDAILRSSPWRATKPLRYLMDRVPVSVRRPVRKALKLAWWTMSFRLASKLRARRRLRRDAQLVVASSLFDPVWYVTRYPDAAAPGIDPLLHYLTTGTAEGRDPGPNFSVAGYRAQCPEGTAGAMNPLVHYLTRDTLESRETLPRRLQRKLRADQGESTSLLDDPLRYQEDLARVQGSGLFDSSWYLGQNPDVAQAGADPLVHFLIRGWREGRDPHPLFDSSWYLDQFPDVAQAAGNPLVHYLAHGGREGRDPHPLFDSSWYLEQYPDVAQAAVNPLGHYLAIGWREGRDPHPLFDSSWYLEQYPDVARAAVNPLVHYLALGWREGRNPNPAFYSSWYLRTCPDIAQAGLNPLIHYVLWGAAERRAPNTWLNTSRYLVDHPDVSAAGHRVLDHVLRTGGDRLRGPRVNGAPPSGADDSAQRAFLRLPWRAPSSCEVNPWHNLQILLISHDATRTGAPRSLLEAANALSVRAGLDCWVLLMDGGSLETEFGDHVPTLNLEALVTPSQSKQQALWEVLMTFRACGERALAVCNTAVLWNVSAMCAQAGIPSIAWIQELPTSIDAYFGGAASFATIAGSSRRILTVSEFAKTALSTRYQVSPDRFQVIYAGTLSEPLEPGRERTRRAIRDELGISQDAFVVLGCGTVQQRKGVDLFTQVAIRILGRLADAWFVWVGMPLDMEILAWGAHDARRAGVARRLIFVGEREDVTPYYQAADLFLMTSREDPFPLADLEAMSMGLPVIAFEGAGGATEIFGDGHGLSVPYLNVERMAEQVLALAQDPDRRRDIGRRARALMERQFRWGRFADEFLALAEQEVRYRRPPTAEVSVVVPMYNSGPYLRRRLQSIFSQTVLPAEIILLDDASTDDSLAIAEDMAAICPCPVTIVRSARNSGSPFKQWQRGFEACHQPLVWLAEADDFCAPTFLEQVLPTLADPTVVLAYAQSAPVDADDRQLAPSHVGYTSDIDEHRWLSSYTVSGLVEIERALCLKNTIPSASAVVVRREAALASINDVLGFRFAGDWMFYVKVAQRGRIAFVAETLNYHRKHSEAVTHKAEYGQLWLGDDLAVRCEIFESLPLPSSRLAETLGRVIAYDEHFKRDLDVPRPVFGDNAGVAAWRERLAACFTRTAGDRATRPRLLLVISDGTAQARPVIGLANALARHCSVFLLNARPSLVDEALSKLISSEVVLLEGTLGPVPWYRLPQPDVTASGVPAFRLTVVSELVRFFDIDILVSNGHWADLLASLLNARHQRDWFIQIDSPTEPLDPNDPENADRQRSLAEAMGEATGICYRLPEDLDRLRVLGLPLPAKSVQLPTRVFQDPRSREWPRISRPGAAEVDRDFCFLLCCQQCPDPLCSTTVKAAAEALSALAPDQRDGRRPLLLIVDAAKEIAEPAGLDRDDSRHLVISAGKWDDALARAHIAVMPCHTPSPSCTSAVIDCLAHGLPVIVSDASRMADFVATEQGPAGLLLSSEAEVGDASWALADAMLAAMTDRALYAMLRDNARAASTHTVLADAAAQACVQGLLAEVRPRPTRNLG